MVGDLLRPFERDGGQPGHASITLNQMIYHTTSVILLLGTGIGRIRHAFRFLSGQSPTEGVTNAIRIMKSGCDALKLEGGAEIIDTVKAILAAGIPVMGHLGLTPQRYQ